MNNHNHFFSFSRNLENQPSFVQANLIPELEQHSFDNLQDAFSFYDGSLLLLGEPGIGKSFLLKEFQQNLKQQNNDHLIIFLQIWTWSNKQLPILDWVAYHKGYSAELLKQKIQGQQVVLVLDGLDELPDRVSKLPEDPNSEKEDYRLEFLQQLSEFNQEFTGVNILVSCRSQDYKDISSNNNIKIIFNGAVELKALKNQDIQDYINQIFDNDTQISKILWNLLRKNRGLRKIVSNPLLLSIFVETCKSTQDIDKVAAIGNIGELFNSFLDKTYERLEKRNWETHGEKLPLSLDDLKNLLGHVAIAMMGDLHPDDNEIYLNTFRLVIQRHYQVIAQNKIDELITLSQQLNLIVSTNQNPVTYSFRHLILRDYLALNFLQKEICNITTATKIEAARALGGINHPRASELLITLLEDQNTDANVCYEAVNSIAELDDGVDFRGYIQDFPRHTISSQINEFSIDNIKEYFNKFAEYRPITNSDAQKFKKLTFGNPLAVKMLANMWRDGVAKDTIFNHPEAPILTKGKKRLVAQLFLNQCLNEQDKQAVYALAVMRRPEKELLRRILKAQDDTELYSRLQQLHLRYSFVLPDEFKLDEQYKVFIQEYLLEPEQRFTPEILDLNRRARNYFQQRLDNLIQNLNIKQQLETQEVTETINNLVHHWQWRDEKEYDENFVWNDTKLTEHLILGWQYNINWARNLLQDATVFTSTIKYKQRWQLFERALASEASLDDKYSLLKYLETEVNDREISPEAMAIILLKRGELLLRQQRNQEAENNFNEALLQAQSVNARDLIPHIQALLPQLKSEIIVEHSDYITSVCPSSDGTKVLSGSFDKALKLWEVSTQNISTQNKLLNCLLTFDGHTEAIYSVYLSRDDKLAISGSADKTIKFWNVQTGNCIKTFEGHTNTVSSVVLSHDNSFVISGSFDKTLKIWDVETGECLSTLDEHQDAVRSVALSPDDGFALSGSFDCSLKLWDIATGECLRTFAEHTAQIRSVCFSSDGKFALSGAFDRTLKYWDVNTGKCLHTFHEDADVYSVSLTNDNRFAISGNGNAIIKIWDISEKNADKTLKVFEEHADVVSSIALTPDNSYGISASGDETIKVWKLDLPKTPIGIKPPSAPKKPDDTEPKNKKPDDTEPKNPWKLATLILLVILSFGFISWIWFVISGREEQNTSIQTICKKATAKAQAGIMNYKSRINQNGNISEDAILRFGETLKELETTYENNGKPDCLEEHLGRIMHTYAIEVSASSGHKQEAIELLKKVPPKYSDFEEVRKRLQKWETEN
ncbi:NACHT and WD40 repeat domain-containing protein [Mastigocoleus testarum]|uniref:NACHT domain-containing protein n=1 Tax=Mastigocoleus testarum BC008 TaxID=371196 RepID=A0A0V7ZYE7_9CYAN|nr:NACHT domain-containing protein [Mastigocoleus testarum]KST69438.1 hypothetical protein BC008_35545 [Mastigocoleus testarum BC008]